MIDDKHSEPEIRNQISTSVTKVFGDFGIAGLDSAEAIGAALIRSRNVLAELAGLYLGIAKLPDGRPATVVYD